MTNAESQAEYRRFSREELYELVWSEPMTTVARRYQMSNPAFARICASMDIPRPDRGYWAKLLAGKRPARAPLPARKPGQSQFVGLGDVDHENVGRVTPETPPTFPDDLPRIEQAVRKSLGRVRVISIDSSCHPAIKAALDEAATRTRSTSQRRSDRPSTVDEAWERRALELLNSLFWVWDRVGGEPKVVPDDGIAAQIRFSSTTVRLSISRVVSRSNAGQVEGLVIAMYGRGREHRAGLEWSDSPMRL